MKRGASNNIRYRIGTYLVCVLAILAVLVTAPVMADTANLIPVEFGNVFNSTISQTFLTIIADNYGGVPTNNTADSYVRLQTNVSGTDTYSRSDKLVFILDLTGYTSETITAATLNVGASQKNNQLGSFNLSVVNGTTEQPRVLSRGDYGRNGTIRMASDLTYTGVSTTAFTDMPLNADGVAYLNQQKGGYAVFYFMLQPVLDSDSSGITYKVPSNASFFRIYNQTGTRPFNVTIVYTTSTPDTTPPEAISNLSNGTPTCNSGSLTWTNPTSDLYQVNYTLNGTYQPALSNTTESLSLTGLPNNTVIMLNFTTVDLAGNRNTTHWQNISFTTAKFCAAAAIKHPVSIDIKNSPGYLNRTIEPWKSAEASMKNSADAGLAIDYAGLKLVSHTTNTSVWALYARDMAVYGNVTGDRKYTNKTVELLAAVDAIRINTTTPNTFLYGSGYSQYLQNIATAYDLVANSTGSTWDTANDTVIRYNVANATDDMYRSVVDAGTEPDVVDKNALKYSEIGTVSVILSDYTGSLPSGTTVSDWSTISTDNFFDNDTSRHITNNRGLLETISNGTTGAFYLGSYEDYYEKEMYRYIRQHNAATGRNLLTEYPFLQRYVSAKLWQRTPYASPSNMLTSGVYWHPATIVMYPLLDPTNQSLVIFNINKTTNTSANFDNNNYGGKIPNTKTLWDNVDDTYFDKYVYVENLSYNTAGATPADATYLFKTGGLSILRDGWSERSQWLMIQTYNEQSIRTNRALGSNDQMAFEYYALGDNLLADAGETKYIEGSPYRAVVSYYNHPAHNHNTILVYNGTDTGPTTNTSGNLTELGFAKAAKLGVDNVFAPATVNSAVVSPNLKLISVSTIATTLERGTVADALTTLKDPVSWTRTILQLNGGYTVVYDTVSSAGKYNITPIFRPATLNITESVGATPDINNHTEFGAAQGKLFLHGSTSEIDWYNMSFATEQQVSASSNGFDWNTTNPYAEQLTFTLFSAPASPVTVHQQASRLAGYEITSEVASPAVLFKSAPVNAMRRVTVLDTRYTTTAPPNINETPVTGDGSAINITHGAVADTLYNGVGNSGFWTYETDADSVLVRKAPTNITDYVTLNATFLNESGIKQFSSTSRLTSLVYTRNSTNVAINISGSGATNLTVNVSGIVTDVKIDGTATDNWVQTGKIVDIWTTLSDHDITYQESGADDLPPEAISNLQNTTTCNSVNITYDSPPDLDFNKTIWRRNDTVIVEAGNTTKFYNFTGLTESTTYAFSGQSCDIAGNCNSTVFGNMTAATGACGVAPVAAFSASNVTPCLGDIVTFTDLSANSPEVWNWTFGDGNQSLLRNPTHIYTSLGLKTVNLTVNNTYGLDFERKVNYINVSDCPVTPVTPSKPISVDGIFSTIGSGFTLLIIILLIIAAAVVVVAAKKISEGDAEFDIFQGLLIFVTAAVLIVAAIFIFAALYSAVSV